MNGRRVSREEQLSAAQLDVVDALYGAVGDPERWPEVIDALSATFGGIAVLLHRSGRTFLDHRVLAWNADPAYAASYGRYYGAINPWVIGSQGPREPVQFGDDQVPAAEFERSEFYADWLRPQGLRYTFNACVSLDTRSRMELAAIRESRMGPISSSEHRVVLELLPHLQRAMELSKRLELTDARRSAAQAAVRPLGTGMLVVDAARRVISSDDQVEPLLAKGGLAIRNGRLRILSPRDVELEEAVLRATGAGRTLKGRGGSLLTVPRPGERLPLSVAVGPIDGRDDPFDLLGPLAMVLVTDPEAGGPLGEDSLRSLYDLTPAEAKLAAALCAGETLATYATGTGASLNTVKTHLKRIFDKTGATRQSDLVRSLSSDLALYHGPLSEP